MGVAGNRKLAGNRQHGHRLRELADLEKLKHILMGEKKGKVGQ
jgi:hypothetical protein